MKKYLRISILMCLYCNYIHAQSVAINTTAATPDASSILDVSSSSKGLLIPRMSTSAITSISNPAKGLLALDTVKNQLMVNRGTPVSPNWQTIVYKSGWNLTGHTGTNPSVNFIGTTDNQPLRFKVNNFDAGLISTTGNLFFGYGSGYSGITGTGNTGIGDATLVNNTSGENNTAIGSGALISNTTGNNNTATGGSALVFNETGSGNTANGFNSLLNNTAGNSNTASGFASLSANTTGYSNVALGIFTLYRNTNSSNLVAIGDSALYNNGLGSSLPVHATINTAVGSKALFSNTTGYENTALGFQSLFNNTTGSSNVALGSYSLYRNTSRSYLLAIGDSALYNNGLGTVNINEGTYNIAIGSKSLFSNTTGQANTALGNGALFSNTSGWANLAIGDGALFHNVEGTGNTAIGFNSLLSSSSGSIPNNDNTTLGNNTLSNLEWGSGNTAIGSEAGFNASLYTFQNCTLLGASSDLIGSGNSTQNMTAIGYGAIANLNNRVRIGNTSVTSIGGQSGWTTFSDGRYKQHVKEDVKGLDFILKLRPVTYSLDIHSLNKALHTRDTTEWSSKYDIEKIRMTGFVAQEVETAAKSVGYDFSGVDKPQNANGQYGLRYAEFVVPLVKAMQEQQQMIEDLKKENAEMKAQLQKLLHALSAK